MVPPASTVKRVFLSHLFGGSTTVWLYGATCLQVHQYCNNFGSGSDKFLLKLSVSSCSCLIFLPITRRHSRLHLYSLWKRCMPPYYCSKNISFTRYILNTTGHTFRRLHGAASVYIGIVIAWTVNQFFIYRIYILSGKNLWLCVVLSILAATRPTFGLAPIVLNAIMVSRSALNLRKHARWVMITTIAIEVIVDGLIAICVSYFLLKGRNKVVASTRGVLNTLLQYTLHTGVILMIFASLELMEVVHWAHTDPTSILVVTSALLHVQVQLYANCFLTMLNARHEIRHRMENSSVVILSGQPMAEREA